MYLTPLANIFYYLMVYTCIYWYINISIIYISQYIYIFILHNKIVVTVIDVTIIYGNIEKRILRWNFSFFNFVPILMEFFKIFIECFDFVAKRNKGQLDVIKSLRCAALQPTTHSFKQQQCKLIKILNNVDYCHY